MTTIDSTSADSDSRTAHPLDLTTESEVSEVREILSDAGQLTEQTRWAALLPEEPSKAEVQAHEPGDQVDRRFRVVLLEWDTGASRDLVVSVTHHRVDVVRELDPATTGQPPIIDAEFDLIEDIIRDSEEWCSALRRRGIDPAAVRAAPLSAGVYGHPEEVGRRITRVLGFRQDHPADSPWAHPVDGVVAYVDLTTRRVNQVIDVREFPVPAEPGNYDDPAEVGPNRQTLRPINITQPEGPSFTVEGNRLRWEKWDLRIGFNEREGLTLHQIGLNGRAFAYRASIAEMLVPYADPSPVRSWINYFDQGEYMFARYANSLALGCDCLGEVHYMDAVIADDFGAPRTPRHAICLHEEDYGVLWKHTDLFTGAAETRRQRRMVISYFTTIGNYDYGYYWYLYLDGTFECEVKATGIPFTSAYPEEGSEFATEVAPGLGAPYHQHLFSARLDMTIDGARNAVDELETQPVPVSPNNPRGNAFRRTRTRLTTEQGAQRMADNDRGRAWRILNPEVTNRYGNPVGYVLRPEGNPVLQADESSVVAQRAEFATRHLWVTRYDPAQRYSAGDFINQHPGGAGLSEWTTADRSVDGEDIVLWHTFGPTHFPRPEDWPVMPVDSAGFALKADGFFDRNPALDVPPNSNGHCAEGDGHAT